MLPACLREPSFSEDMFLGSCDVGPFPHCSMQRLTAALHCGERMIGPFMQAEHTTATSKLPGARANTAADVGRTEAVVPHREEEVSYAIYLSFRSSASERRLSWADSSPRGNSSRHVFSFAFTSTLRKVSMTRSATNSNPTKGASGATTLARGLTARPFGESRRRWGCSSVRPYWLVRRNPA